MAYLENRLGNSRFVMIEGEPIPPAHLIRVSSYPSVAGEAFKLLAPKGQPYTLVTYRDVPSEVDADVLLTEYNFLRELGPQVFIKNGSPRSYHVKVESVIEVQRSRITNPVGNCLSVDPKFLVICRWECRSTPVPPS